MGTVEKLEEGGDKDFNFALNPVLELTKPLFPVRISHTCSCDVLDRPHVTICPDLVNSILLIPQASALKERTSFPVLKSHITASPESAAAASTS
jgi:hypothetical protein